MRGEGKCVRGLREGVMVVSEGEVRESERGLGRSLSSLVRECRGETLCGPRQVKESKRGERGREERML